MHGIAWRYVRRHHVALLALFAALGGTSYAALPLRPARNAAAGTPLIRVSDGTTQTVAVALVFQDLTWDTNQLAVDFTHTPGTAAITVNTTGTYWVDLRLRWQRNGGVLSTGRECVFVNGVATACESAALAGSGEPVVIPLTALLQLSAGDIVTIRITADSVNSEIEPGPDTFSGNELSIAQVNSPPPSAVAVASFDAQARAGGVQVRWRTAQEAQLLGFNVYREQGTKRLRLNRSPIPARGATTGGRPYAFLDRRAPRTGTLRYWLEALSLNGARKWEARATLHR